MDEFAVRLQRGDRSLGEGKNPEAGGELRAALALDPGSVKALFKLGIALERQRKWLEAETAYRQAVRCKRDHALAWLRLAATCRRQGKYVDEEHAIREAVRFATTSAEARHNLAVALDRLGRTAVGARAHAGAIGITST